MMKERKAGRFLTLLIALALAAGLLPAASASGDEGFLTSIVFRNGMTAKSSQYEFTEFFMPALREYTLTVPDYNSQPYLWVTLAEGLEGASVTASYKQISSDPEKNGVIRSVAVTAGKESGTNLPYLIRPGGYGNTLTLTVEHGGESQEYTIKLVRTASLASLAVSSPEGALPLAGGFEREGGSYTVSVPDGADPVTLTASRFAGEAPADAASDGYTLTVDGKPVENGAEVRLELGGASKIVTVEALHDEAASTLYKVCLLLQTPARVSFTLEPENAVLSLTDTLTGRRALPSADGAYALCDGGVYSYTFTLNGYIGQNGEFTASDGREYTLTLEKAAENTALNASLTAEWPDFRGGSDNNGVTDAPIPTDSSETVMYWASKLGDGYDSGAVGSPIIVNGRLITYAGSTLYMVDMTSGKTLASAKMDHASSFSITPPTYAEGMIFVALSDGTVQAFNAGTLEAVWIYKDPLGGQPNCPIAYCGGYIYTGFWNSETQDANFVCLSIADEDPERPDEVKTASWVHTSAGGFYWAGAYVCGDFLLVGTDDGKSGSASQTSSLLSLDPRTGEALDTLTGLNGDIRSSVCLDESTGDFYFTSKGGTFYSVKADSDGRLSSLEAIELGGMSTSTPVVHNGRAYIGVCGEGQFRAYGGHRIAVIDLESRSVAYSVETQGYPQTSGLLTTAYEADGGYAYVYFFDNYTPGKLRVLKDRAGQTEADYVGAETKNGEEIMTARVLLTPSGEQAQYAICSPVCDEYGTLYFKNDSGFLMAAGSAAKSLDITTPPDRTAYTAGESFEPAGIKLTASFSNGLARDVTRYAEYKTAPLTPDDRVVTVSFPYLMYSDSEGASGVECEKPYAGVNISVAPASSVSPEELFTPAWRSVAALALSGTTLIITLALACMRP